MMVTIEPQPIFSILSYPHMRNEAMHRPSNFYHVINFINLSFCIWFVGGYFQIHITCSLNAPGSMITFQCARMCSLHTLPSLLFNSNRFVCFLVLLFVCFFMLDHSPFLFQHSAPESNIVIIQLFAFMYRKLEFEMNFWNHKWLSSLRLCFAFSTITQLKHRKRKWRRVIERKNVKKILYLFARSIEYIYLSRFSLVYIFWHNIKNG